MRRIAGSPLPSTMRWVSSEKSSGSTSGSGDSGESGIGRIRSSGGDEAAAIAGVAVGGDGAGGGALSPDPEPFDDAFDLPGEVPAAANATESFVHEE